MLHVILTIIEMIVCFLLQTSVPFAYNAGSVTPDLMLVLTVGCAYRFGRSAGILTGFACGILTELLFGGSIGLSAILYMTIGYFVGIAAKYYIPDDHTLPTLFIALGEMFYCLLYYAATYLLRGEFTFGVYFTEIILPRFALTMLTGVILYRIINLTDPRPKQEGTNLTMPAPDIREDESSNA